MAILGIQINKKNPEYTKEDFLFWMPQFANIDTLNTLFDNLYPIANEKIFYSIFGTDWKFAMSLCIAHYATLIGSNQQIAPGSTLQSIAGGGVTKGVLASASVGGFNKTYDIDKSIINDKNAVWWNSTSYGAQLMALYATKPVPSVFVVTSDYVPGGN